MPSHQKLAFKIAIFLLRQFKDNYKILPYATELVLTRLGYLPTIDHMLKREDGEDYFSYFHEADDSFFIFTKFPGVYAKKLLNQFEINPNWKLTLTNFQAKIFRSILNNENVSVSGPTSAGKSHIIHNYIASRMLDSSGYSVVYLVPTKSLIAEVQKSTVNLLNKLKLNLNEIDVVNSAERLNSDQYENVQKRVLVLTQERLQYVLTRSVDFTIDLLVVDEAQKVKEEERGVILEDAVEIDPNHVGALVSKANILSDMKKHDEALALVDKALSIEPTSTYALKTKKLIEEIKDIDYEIAHLKKKLND